MIIKYKAETFDFEPDCPIEVLEDQEYYMREYLKVLEIRAEIEKNKFRLSIDFCY